MDRDYDLRQTFEANRASYLRSKRDKNGADVIALLQIEADVKKVKALVTKYHLTKDVIDTLYAIGSNESSRVLYRRLGAREVQQQIEGIVRAIR